MRRKKRYLLPGDVKAKIHLFLPTYTLYFDHSPLFLTFTHFLFFTLHFLFLFVLHSKDFIVFLQKNQKTYQMKRNKKTFYTLLYIAGIISIWLLPLQAFGSIKLDGKRLSAKDGLSCNTVNDIIQDRDGFIWFGTPNGVSRYDGYQFINFTNLSKNSGQKPHHSISTASSTTRNTDSSGATIHPTSSAASTWKQLISPIFSIRRMLRS